MKEQVFSPDNVWHIYSHRLKKSWFVKCPSRSGAKIYLCNRHGVPASAGPFESELWPEDEVPAGQLIQAAFLRPDDPRNWP